MCTSWRAQREAVFSDVLYPNMTFAMASDTQKSVATLDAPCACLVSGCPAFRDQRTERIRSLTCGLCPHLNLNGVGMLGLLGGANSGGWEDIIVLSFSLVALCSKTHAFNDPLTSAKM